MSPPNPTQRVWPRAIAVMVLTFAIAACSGLKTYANTSDDNLLVQTTTSSGSLFSSVKAYLHIYRMAGTCRGDYLGTVKLNRKSIHVGIPSGQPLYLRFAFVSSSGFGSSTSVVPQDVVMTPVAGAKYIADISYEDSIYNAVVRDARGRAIGGDPPRCASGG